MIVIGKDPEKVEADSVVSFNLSGGSMGVFIL